MFESGTQTCSAETKTAVYQSHAPPPNSTEVLPGSGSPARDCSQVVFAFGGAIGTVLADGVSEVLYLTSKPM